MIGDGEIGWHDMGPALEAIFSLMTKGGRRLTAHDVEYLKYRLFNGCVNETDPIVTWHQFYKERLDRIGSDPNDPRKKCTFSFWEWLFRIGDMIQEKSGRDTGVSDMWEERYIEGFVSKQEAEMLLSQSSVPMMLIRFSDNQLAGLSIVYQDPYSREINHLSPFKFKEEIEKLTLPVMVVNCEEVRDIQIIYPDKPRERIEDKIAASKRSVEEHTEFSTYKNRTLVIPSNGEKIGSRTPSYPVSPSPAYFSVSSKPSNTVAPPSQLFQQRRSSGNVKAEPSPSPNPLSLGNSSHGCSYGMEITNDFGGQMNQWDGQFDSNLDDQRMQRILQDLMQSDDNDDMDPLVQMVQSFDSLTANQETPQANSNVLQPQHVYYGNSFPTSTNYDFEML